MRLNSKGFGPAPRAVRCGLYTMMWKFFSGRSFTQVLVRSRNSWLYGGRNGIQTTRSMGFSPSVRHEHQSVGRPPQTDKGYWRPSPALAGDGGAFEVYADPERTETSDTLVKERETVALPNQG